MPPLPLSEKKKLMEQAMALRLEAVAIRQAVENECAVPKTPTAAIPPSPRTPVTSPPVPTPAIPATTRIAPSYPTTPSNGASVGAGRGTKPAPLVRPVAPVGPTTPKVKEPATPVATRTISLPEELYDEEILTLQKELNTLQQERDQLVQTPLVPQERLQVAVSDKPLEYQEKRQLMQDIVALKENPDVVKKIMEIAKKGAPRAAAPKDGDAWELNINQLDGRTGRELQTYVQAQLERRKKKETKTPKRSRSAFPDPSGEKKDDDEGGSKSGRSNQSARTQSTTRSRKSRKTDLGGAQARPTATSNPGTFSAPPRPEYTPAMPTTPTALGMYATGSPLVSPLTLQYSGSPAYQNYAYGNYGIGSPAAGFSPHYYQQAMAAAMAFPGMQQAASPVAQVPGFPVASFPTTPTTPSSVKPAVPASSPAPIPTPSPKPVVDVVQLEIPGFPGAMAQLVK
eukprot:TRINITY_DN14407_c0_g1_i2.p1 TRINITY_DN14407_c0_g1~~TRINITY_DN14407_c0_g1_i2.p1  ORF type:complete len:462 (-),score=67.60 TRINITY_DN14407_c0_g1_i2:338-1702(-)